MNARIAVAAALLVASLGTAASADDAGAAALKRMFAAEAKTTSFHVASPDFVDADIVRPSDAHAIITPLDLYVIGDDVYAKDVTKTLPYLHQSGAEGKKTVEPFLVLLRGPEAFAAFDGIVATDGGAAMLDDKPLHKITLSMPGEKDVFVMWIGADDLVYAVDVPTDPGKPPRRLRYSNYDAVPKITAPPSVG